MLGATLSGSGRAAAQAADDSGWFDPEPAPAPAEPPAQGVAPAATTPPASDDADPRALSDFKPHLDPYGSWVQDPRYGTVWVPHEQSVGPGFAPYVSSGQWQLASTGEWVWVSDYPFGWIVFHYGRWVWTGSGWAWVPGYRYAPAWVSWRVPSAGYAYVGWAPVGPDFIWVNGHAVGYYYPPPYYWVFCPSSYAFHVHVHRYIVRDRGLQYRLAASTRHYAPASPRRVPATPTPRAGRLPASPTPKSARVPASPTPEAARVPAAALPKERVRLPQPPPRSVATPAPATRSVVPAARNVAAERQRQAVSPAPVRREKAQIIPKNPPRAAVVPSPRKPATLRPAPPSPVLDSARRYKKQR
jgi:hypothetical protein